MSSKYTKQRDHRNPCNTRSINLSKVAGALQNPNGMTLNWKSPECVAKAVLHQASGDRDTCQYPLARSRVENHCLPAKYIQCIIYSRHRVRVLDRRQIQPAVIHTEPGSAIFLSHHHHRYRSRGVAWLDLSAGQHLFYADFLLFNLLGRHMPRSAPHRRVVTGINGVFHSIHVSGQGRTRYGEEVHKLQQCISQLAFL